MDVRRAHAFDSRPMTDEPGKILTGGREGGGEEELGRVRNEGFNAYISRFLQKCQRSTPMSSFLHAPSFLVKRMSIYIFCLKANISEDFTIGKPLIQKPWPMLQ